jgi:hypothetical protein
MRACGNGKSNMHNPNGWRLLSPPTSQDQVQHIGPPAKLLKVSRRKPLSLNMYESAWVEKDVLGYDETFLQRIT